ncbi:MAG: aryl-sulfate sulfotransferase [Candidatus Dormibacter sp.]
MAIKVGISRHGGRRALYGLLVCAVPVVWSTGSVVTVHAAPGQGNEDSIAVTGAVTNITSGPSSLGMTPTFSQSIHDYVIHCAAGTNQVTFTVTATSGTTTTQRRLVENQPEIVQGADPSNPSAPYWIRCLPHDFPTIAATATGAGPTPGYYFTGNISEPVGSPVDPYAMVLDTNGTPVWYQSTPTSATNVQLLPNDNLSWSPVNGPGIGATPGVGFQLFNLDTQTTQKVPSPIQPPDLHELLQLPNGDRMELATPVVQCHSCFVTPPWPVNINSFVDCVVQEVDTSGNLVWSWDAKDHIGINENRIALVVPINGQNVADAYHCNSIDVDLTAVDPSAPANPRSDDVLISLRNTSAVYRINRANTAKANQILWKLGGQPTDPAPQDGEPVLTVSGDSEWPISGQHDARFQSGGGVSLFDDHTGGTGAARAVQYHVTTGISIPTAVAGLTYNAPDGTTSNATGSFRRYGGTGGDNVVGWGFHTNPVMSEVDDAMNPLLTFSFGDGTSNTHPNVFEYRFLKLPLTAVNINLLRHAVGPPHPSSAPKSVHFAALDPAHGASAVGVSDSSLWFEKSLGGNTLGPPQVGATGNPFFGSIGTYFGDLGGTQKQASAIAINEQSIWVEPNTGNDMFGAPLSGESGNPFVGAVGTYVADLDNRHQVSAIAVDASSVWIEPNLGNNTFGPPQFAGGGQPFSGSVGTYVADIDGTGKASIIAVDASSIWIEHNNGNDTFGPPQFAGGGNFSGNVGTYVADIDGAGKASIIAVNTSSVWIEKNQGNDTFGAPQFAEGEVPFAGTVGTYVADLNGDGHSSVIAVNPSSISVERNQGNDTFSSPQSAVSSGPFYGTH